jgi:hypothetical protein
VVVVVDGLFSCLGTLSNFHWSVCIVMSLVIKVLIHPKKKSLSKKTFYFSEQLNKELRGPFDLCT